jgi:hypothetical protein
LKDVCDVTALAAEEDDVNSLVQFVNIEFQKVCTYFRKNQLSLHPDKTTFLLISNSKMVQNTDVSIFINNNNQDQNYQSKI